MSEVETKMLITIDSLPQDCNALVEPQEQVVLEEETPHPSIDFASVFDDAKQKLIEDITNKIRNGSYARDKPTAPGYVENGVSNVFSIDNKLVEDIKLLLETNCKEEDVNKAVRDAVVGTLSAVEAALYRNDLYSSRLGIAFYKITSELVRGKAYD